jgi:hypothetical protein
MLLKIGLKKISYDHRIISVFGRDRLYFTEEKSKPRNFLKFSIPRSPIGGLFFPRSTLLKKMEQFIKTSQCSQSYNTKTGIIVYDEYPYLA